MELPIRSNHGVMGRIGKLHAGTEEGDGAMKAAIEDRGGVRREPGSPSIIGESASFGVQIAHRILGSRDYLRLHIRVPIDDDAHVSIRSPRSRRSFWMLPCMLPIEQDGYSLMIESRSFFL